MLRFPSSVRWPSSVFHHGGQESLSERWCGSLPYGSCSAQGAFSIRPDRPWSLEHRAGIKITSYTSKHLRQWSGSIPMGFRRCLMRWKDFGQIISTPPRATNGQKLFLVDNCSHPIEGQTSKTPWIFICFGTHSYIVWVSHGEISWVFPGTQPFGWEKNHLLICTLFRHPWTFKSWGLDTFFKCL